MSKTIGILTGGGDVPGLNTCIKEVVLGAIDEGYQVFGIRRGWMGLLHYDLDDTATHEFYVKSLDRLAVRTIDRSGGTFLHTSRTNPQKVKQKDIPLFLTNSQLGKPNAENGTVDYTAHVLKVLEHLGIERLISIGGDDTLSFSVRLHQEGFPIIGIPKTMDNDVNGTDYCIGFSTAVTRSVDLITKMRTPVGSHERIGIVELFGRNSGATSLLAAYLAQVDRALISEVPFEMQKLADLILEDKRDNPSNYAIMTVSEGATLKGGQIIETGEADAYGHRKLGGIGQIVSEEIKRITGQNTMYQSLGYMMRSGPPDSLDRMVSMAFGTLAFSLLKKGESGKLVGLTDGRYSAVPLEMVTAGKRAVDVASYYDKDAYKPKILEFLHQPMLLR